MDELIISFFCSSNTHWLCVCSVLRGLVTVFYYLGTRMLIYVQPARHAGLLRPSFSTLSSDPQNPAILCEDHLLSSDSWCTSVLNTISRKLTNGGTTRSYQKSTSSQGSFPIQTHRETFGNRKIRTNVPEKDWYQKTLIDLLCIRPWLRAYRRHPDKGFD